MKKWHQILWGSKEEDDLEERIASKVVNEINLEQKKVTTPDPDELTIENAYKTRWIWYHTILGGLMFFANIIMLAIFLLLAIKL
jgi:hypothetical protein